MSMVYILFCNITSSFGIMHQFTDKHSVNSSLTTIVI